MTRKRSLPSHHHQRICLYDCCEDRSDILIVDDNAFNIVTLQTMIEGGKLKLTSDKAMNGEQAVNKVKERLELDKHDTCVCDRKRGMYKIIFMDCNMPVMDGFQATTEIRKIIHAFLN